MAHRLKLWRQLLDADALKALALYGGATLLLGLACARDLERSLNVVVPAGVQGTSHVVGR